jgi:putative colanic acid biosysnthesis UDP-glucose lipid carrier transferase
LATRYSKFTRSIYLFGDMCLLNISFFLAYLYRFESIEFEEQPYYIILILYFNLSWVASAFFLKVYDSERVDENKISFKKTIKLLLLHCLLVAAFIVFRKGYYYSREQMLLTYSILSVSVLLWRFATINFFRVWRAKGHNYSRVVIVGAGEIAQDLRSFFLNNPQYGYRFIGFFDDHAPVEGDVKGRIKDIKQYSVMYHVDEIYCSLNSIDNERVNDLINFAENNMIRVKIIPDFRGISFKKINLTLYDNFPVLTFREIPLDDLLNQFTKRAFDIVFSLFVIVFVLTWMVPLIGLIIKLNSKGPVFFRQLRAGKNGKVFWCYKFRSMYVHDECEFKQATRGDQRITKVGEILRKTNLDEFPQFVNVLLGQMSVVGPRPHPFSLNESYKDVVNRYMDRHLVKPGVTGLAQVKGYRGETATPQHMRNRVRVDMFYIENWTFRLDLKIITMTIISMIRGDRNAF